MTAKNNPVPKATDREIVSTRVLAASREAVFAAFSDPVRLAQWWGPRGFSCTISEFELRPGGRWHLVLRGPDGTEYPNEKEFTEVVRPERVVFRHLDPVHGFQMTMLFDDQVGKTRLTWRLRFESAAEFAKVKDFIAVANEENFDRLEDHLTTKA